MNTVELVKALEAVLELWEGWKHGVFKNLGIEWVHEPPAIIQAREALKHCNELRCTGDGRTCPVEHDHP